MSAMQLPVELRRALREYHLRRGDTSLLYQHEVSQLPNPF